MKKYISVQSEEGWLKFKYPLEYLTAGPSVLVFDNQNMVTLFYSFSVACQSGSVPG